MSTADDQALIQNVLLFFSSIFQIKSSCVGKRGTLFFMPSCTNRVMEFKMPMKGPNHLLLLLIRYLYLLKIISGKNTCPKTLQSNWNY